MSDTSTPLLIKRYASRRLYNTQTSDYVTLEDIAGFIREGREVQIIDLKTGNDLTRQYLIQIIAEHESRGESVLPVDVLTDLVRSYMTPGTSVVPQFLKVSFDMLREGQSKMLENISTINPIASPKPNPLSKMPGFEMMQAQQEAFVKAMSSGFPQGWPTSGAASETKPEPTSDAEGLDDIKQQLAELQEKLSKLG